MSSMKYMNAKYNTVNFDNMQGHATDMFFIYAGDIFRKDYVYGENSKKIAIGVRISDGEIVPVQGTVLPVSRALIKRSLKKLADHIYDNRRVIEK